MQLKFIPYFIGLSIFNLSTYAEPPLQQGDTVENLSRVHIQTRVNGQAGSIQDLVNAGKIQLIQTPNASTLNPANPQQDQSTTPEDAVKTPHPIDGSHTRYPRTAEPGDIIPLPASQSGSPSTIPPSSTIPKTSDQPDPTHTPKYGQPDLASPIP